jgi:2-keto-4-pentenoate hydratase/2-oxohepta-3-ene-1,7-dioic acid hydratase in catechol pathway
MRLGTVVLHGDPAPALLNAELTAAFPLREFRNTLDFLRAGPEAWALAAEAASVPSAFVPFERLLAPILRPKMICIGLNYRDHAAELKQEIPKKPVVFTKFSNSIIGPGEPVVLTSATAEPDYEAEYAFVIGKTAKSVKAEDWPEYVFGFTAANDVTARDVQFSVSQWDMGKSFDTFGPIGPVIVSRDEVADPHKLAIKLDIDGEVMQQSNTEQLIFNTGALIEYLSSMMTLEPGDVISTGTPPGVGMGRNPKRWLRAGETVTVELEGVGRLSNPIVQG